MTTAPKDTRPFNLEHARAGAPYCCANGDVVKILKFDLVGKGPMAGFVHNDGEDFVQRWCADGTTGGFLGSNATLVMLPLGHIDGKPVFVGDEIEMAVFGHKNRWKLVKAEPNWAGTWNDDGKVARWPAPAKVYPETKMTTGELFVRTGYTVTNETLHEIANAALRHAIDAGQVVTKEDHEAALILQGERLADIAIGRSSANIQGYEATMLVGGIGTVAGSRNAIEYLKAILEKPAVSQATRDMAIAEAVRDACRNNFTSENTVIKVSAAYGRISNVSLEGVIAGVKS